MNQVDWFVVGVQKGGTTALADYLRRHPALQVSTRKEVHYFDDDNLNWRHPDRSRLHHHFDWTRPGLLRGELTPIYIYWSPALERLRDYNRQAKLIVMLRHPTFRAYSHWRMERKRAAEPLSFADAISEAGRRRVASAPLGQHRVFSYVERGLYVEQIDRLLALFPRQQVHFLTTDQLWRTPGVALIEIERFLDVRKWFEGGVVKDYVVPLDTRDQIENEAAAQRQLNEFYRDTIARTASLTCLDLGEWLDPAYRDLE